MRGDVVLYESSGSLFDRMIETFTHGRFTHGEIDLGGGKLIGAHYDGIVVHEGTLGRNVAVFTPPASKTDIEYGLAWAVQQAGKQYGWADILSNGFLILGIPIYLGEPGRWDCSDFVTRYLSVARAAGPLGKQVDEPGLISPNDIARAYGVK